MRVERRVGCKQDPAEWVRCWFAENVAQPSELGAKDESGKAVGTAATAYFFMRDPTDVGGGEFEYAAEATGLGGIDFLVECWEKWEQVQTPPAFCSTPGRSSFRFRLLRINQIARRAETGSWLPACY